MNAPFLKIFCLIVYLCVFISLMLLFFRGPGMAEVKDILTAISSHTCFTSAQHQTQVTPHHDHRHTDSHWSKPTFIHTKISQTHRWCALCKEKYSVNKESQTHTAHLSVWVLSVTRKNTKNFHRIQFAIHIAYIFHCGILCMNIMHFLNQTIISAHLILS